MQITIHILPNGKEYEKRNHYRTEMIRAQNLLMDTLDAQIMSSKDYGVGSGVILDRSGKPLITYEIKP